MGGTTRILRLMTSTEEPLYIECSIGINVVFILGAVVENLSQGDVYRSSGNECSRFVW